MLRSKSRDSLRFHCKFGQKSGRPKWGRNELFSRLGKSRFLDGKGQLPARARVGFWGWKDGEPSSSLPSLKRGGGARKRRGPDHGSWMCGFGLARAREMFWVRKDEETWSYRSSRPKSVPTYLPHWSTRKRTENAVRETHLE